MTVPANLDAGAMFNRGIAVPDDATNHYTFDNRSGTTVFDEKGNDDLTETNIDFISGAAGDYARNQLSNSYLSNTFTASGTEGTIGFAVTMPAAYGTQQYLAYWYP